MLLVYYQMYLTYDLTGHLFGLDQSNVSRNIKYLEPAVKQSIPSKLYADSKKINSMQQFFPELIAMIHGTEQSIPRPKDKRKRKTHYSGKKHTIKNQITINLDGIIIYTFIWAVIMIISYTNQNIQYYQNSCHNFMASYIWEFKKTFQTKSAFYHTRKKRKGID